MALANLDIRLEVSDNNIRYKDIAEKAGITPEHLSRLMRKPLSINWNTKIWDIVQELKTGGAVG